MGLESATRLRLINIKSNNTNNDNSANNNNNSANDNNLRNDSSNKSDNSEFSNGPEIMIVALSRAHALLYLLFRLAGIFIWGMLLALVFGIVFANNGAWTC